MPCQDLLLIRQESVLIPFIPNAKLSAALRSGRNACCLGKKFSNLGSCCEWLEIVDLQNCLTVGLCFVDFYEKPEHPSVLGLKAQNVHWDSEGEATFLFWVSKSWKKQPGPYLPVSFLNEPDGGKCYFIFEGLPADGQYRGVLQVLEGDAWGS